MKIFEPGMMIVSQCGLNVAKVLEVGEKEVSAEWISGKDLEVGEVFTFKVKENQWKRQ